MAVSGAIGVVVERVLIFPVYGQHLKQILMTTGGLIVAEQALYALWGPQIIPLPLPTSLRDRKSTRLNSSHANISYAVFCLKKKKNRTTDDNNELFHILQGPVCNTVTLH